MAVTVDNLRINNASAVGTVRVTDNRPTLSWEFGGDTLVSLTDPPREITGSEEATQASYEIRIGTSSADAGTNAFVGDVAATGVVASDASAWRYNGFDVLRGQTYYGQIRLADGYGTTSGWVTFSFKYNSLPVASGVAISPVSPSEGGPLSVEYEYADADNDLEGPSAVRWYRNGVHERQLDAHFTVPSEYVKRGDTWVVHVRPHDGYEYGDTAGSASVEVVGERSGEPVENARVEPTSPTVGDPLYAQYDYAGDDTVSVRWYVNGQLISAANDRRFYRFDLEEGDEVYFVATTDTSDTRGTPASPAVVVAAAPYRVINLRVNGQQEALDVAPTRPVFSWDVISPDGGPANVASIKVGRHPGGDDVFSVVVALPEHRYVFSAPDVLRQGEDYWLTVSVGADEESLGSSQTVHFRTAGSLWEATADNATGWTVEALLAVMQDANVTDGYQGIRLADGSKFVELRLFPDMAVVVSSKSTQIPLQLSGYNTFTIVGSGETCKLFVNHQLVGSVTLEQSTTERYAEFGMLAVNGDANWLSFRYTTDGAYEPDDDAFAAVDFHEELELAGREVTALAAADDAILLATQSADGTAEVYEYRPHVPPTTHPTVSETYSPVNRIVFSVPHAKYTYFCHANGATYFKSYPIVAYDSAADLSDVTPEDAGWRMTASDASAQSAATNDGLVVDTRGGGKWYYSQDSHGTPWFDLADNARGWTVDFTLRVNDFRDENLAVEADAGDGFGVYVNDGVAGETLRFTDSGVSFASSDVRTSYDTTVARDYRLTGRGASVELWGKLPSESTYAQLLRGTTSFAGTSEGNAGAPSVAEDAAGVSHAVWHDDGKKAGRQVYYAKYEDGAWSPPVVIVPASHNASNPRIAATGDRLFVVFEQRNSEYATVGLVVGNEAGWSSPTNFIDAGHEAKSPAIAVRTDGTIDVVWEDYRHLTPSIYHLSRDAETGEWGSEYRLATAARRPAIDAAACVAVSWTQQISASRTSILCKVYDTATGEWEWADVSSTDSVEADYSDVVIHGTNVHVVWHDNRVGEFCIYANRLNKSLVSQSGVLKLTTGSTSSRFPRIGHSSRTTSGPVVVVFQRSNDMDEGAGVGSPPQPASSVYAVVFDTTANTWYASDQSGNDVLLDVGVRYARRPAVAKHAMNLANVLYEAEDVGDGEEMQRPAEAFAVVHHASYDFTKAASFTVETDLRVSGVLPRKEIRFGDFSDAYKGRMSVSAFSFYAHDAVDPFESGTVSSGTAEIEDDRAYNALANDHGDAWLATRSGLAFYLKGENKIALIKDGDIGGVPAKSVAVSRDGTLFVATDAGLFHSRDHVNFAAVTVDGVAAGTPVEEVVVDFDGALWVRTTDSVVRCELDEELAATPTTSPLTLDEVTTIELGDGVKVIAMEPDPDAGMWLGTDSSGLFHYSSGLLWRYDTQNSGILSNHVTSVAIRSAGVRYVGTSGGVCEMTGTRFGRLTADDTRWNNNVRALAFREPNVLWVSSLSNVCQVQLDENRGMNKALVFGVGNYALDATAYDDLRTFRTTGEAVGSRPADAATWASEPDPYPGAMIEVLVNGRRVDHGYEVSADVFELSGDGDAATASEVGPLRVRFESPLKHGDIVQLRYRNDVRRHATMRQNQAEVAALGKKETRIESLAKAGDEVYARVEVDGTPLLYKYDVDGSELPGDAIVLDTTPPTGALRILRQISKYQLEVGIDYADDNLSGVSKMVVSDHPNGTNDGETPVEPVDFASTFVHTIGADLKNVLTLHEFSASQGTGSRVVRFKVSDDDNTYYVGTSGPAKILRWDEATSQVVEVASLDPAVNATVDLFVVFKNRLYATVGHEGGGTSRVYYSDDGRTFRPLYNATISAAHIYAACELNGFLYFGDSNGKVYSFSGNDPTFDSTAFEFEWDTGQKTIYAMQAANGSLFLATGDGGNVVQINADTGAQTIVYSGEDPYVTAIDVLTRGGRNTLYAGNDSGRVFTRNVIGGVWEPNYATEPDRVQAIKIDDFAMRMAIGQTLYGATALPTFSGWAPLADFAEDVRDFEPSVKTGDDAESIDVWVVTDAALYRFTPPAEDKFVYLRLIDNAGNQTADGDIFDSVGLDDLVGFVNSNRILKLSPTGETLDVIEGSAPFYSAKQIEDETGEYYSEIFFGTNNLVSWDTLSWVAETPTGTDVEISLRTADSRDEVLTAPWEVAYGSTLQNGVNVSFLRGRYIQFRAVLSSTVAGETPKLSKVVIKSRTSEATHFFTTNFILGSRIRRGLLTAQMVVPVAADIVFGLNTTNSVDFRDYQEVPLNKVFEMDEDQVGDRLRVGIKFITPTPAELSTDTFGEYGEYDEPLYVNVVDFVDGSEGVKHYRVTFYKDRDMTEVAYTTDTVESTDGWSVDGEEFPADGVEVTAGPNVEVLYAPDGDAPLVCNTYYHVKVEEYDALTDAWSLNNTGNAFVKGCNTSYVDQIGFDFTAPMAADYHFRVRFYNDAERTDLAKTYYTGTNASLWKLEGEAFPSTGGTFTSGQTQVVSLRPPLEDLNEDKVYHLSIDALNKTLGIFGAASNSLTFRVSDPLVNEYCGEYQNAPFVTNFGLILELFDKRLITLNKN